MLFWSRIRRRFCLQKVMTLFDQVLSVPAEDLEILLRPARWVPWADFLLNPRRLRGSDFLMRWSQGVWSEKRIIEAVRRTNRFVAIPYGPSGTAPDDDPRAYELYFERLERASSDGMKRPDLLIFRQRDESPARQIIGEIGGVEELPFTHEDDDRMSRLLNKAILAIGLCTRIRQDPHFRLLSEER